MNRNHGSYNATTVALAELHAGIITARPHLRARERKVNGALRGYSYYLPLQLGREKRVIRILEMTAGQYDLVRAASERATRTNARQRISGSLSALLPIIDEQVALIQKEEADDFKQHAPLMPDQRVEKSKPTPSADFTSSYDVSKSFVPEIVSNEVDATQPLIYRWQIFDSDGHVVGVYIGLAGKDRAQSRMARYRSRVLGIQQGRPYSTTDATKDYRRIHRALAAAVDLGHRIVLTYLCNCAADEDLKTLETQLIHEHSSYGSLPHQLNDRL